MIISRLIAKFRHFYVRRSSASYIAYLRSIGIAIGEGTYIQNPRTTEIDITRPSLITIGKDCFFNDHVELHTHDYVTHLFLRTDREFVNSSGRISIGNNVAFGRHVMVLKGVKIVDNCFIGANSTVTRDIPANSIAVGSPARVVMSLDEYYQKRLSVCEAEALDYARSIQERFHRKPVPAEFWEEFPLFVGGNEVDKYPEIPIRKQLGPSYERYVASHKAKYDSFEDFLKAANLL